MTAPTILLKRSDGSFLGVLIIVVVLALAGTIAIAQHRIHRTEERVAAAALSVSNVLASRDSTRELMLSVRATGDSLRIFQRRVIQVSQRRDALDAALRIERAARYSMDATVDSLHRTLASVVAEDPAHRWRFADFTLRRTPYTLEAHVEVPAPPDSARMSVRVQLDTLPLEVRVSCGAFDASGIRGASVTTTAPRWAAVRLQHVEQSPEVCSPPPARGRRLRFSPLVVGAGRSFAGSGPSAWSLFVGIGLAL